MKGMLENLTKSVIKMNIISNKRIICISILILTVLSTSIGFTYAATSQELRNQQADIDKQIEELNSEIAGKKSEMTTALNQINKLNSEISTYENEISDLQTQIDTLNVQIGEKEANIAEQQVKFDEQKESLEKRLVAMYESGTTSYLDMLLSSKGLADFVSKYYLISQLAEYDQELLNKIEATRIAIETEKQSLEAAKTEIENSKSAVETKKTSLTTSRNEKKSIVSTLSEEEAKLQEELEEFEADKKAIQAELAALASKNNVTAVAPSAAGYISPIPGKSKRNITTGYYGYVGHTGVDFACSAGTPIVAVKSGTVVISTALKRSNGTYKSYGEYVVIDHHDGTMTLYAHMLPGSRTVSKNQNVSQGQTIGQVGTTGNSTGNHLHFEVRINGRHVNPTPYLP